VITACSLSDEQIEQLFDSLPPGHADVTACLDAKFAPMGSHRRSNARARVAEILNAAKHRKHWPDCAVNHGGTECDMGPECGDEDAAAEEPR
jgi:hypothetical protein